MLAVMTVTSLSDGTLEDLAGDGELSLREAIEAITIGANVDGIRPTSGAFGSNDEIVFASALFDGGAQSIALAAGEIQILQTVLIAGPGAEMLTIDARDGADRLPGTGDGHRVFNVDDGTRSVLEVEINALTLTWRRRPRAARGWDRPAMPTSESTSLPGVGFTVFGAYYQNTHRG